MESLVHFAIVWILCSAGFIVYGRNYAPNPPSPFYGMAVVAGLLIALAMMSTSIPLGNLR